MAAQPTMASSGGKVTVGCKLPAGLILTLWKMEKTSEPVMGGGMREVERAVFADSITVRGSLRKPGEVPSISEVAFGYGITPGIDEDSWNEWMKHNKGSAMVRNGLVFAHAKTVDAMAQAKDGESVVSGFEAINPDKPPAEFQRKIKTADKV